jgi:hypothetical protein
VADTQPVRYQTAQTHIATAVQAPIQTEVHIAATQVRHLQTQVQATTPVADVQVLRLARIAEATRAVVSVAVTQVAALAEATVVAEAVEAIAVVNPRNTDNQLECISYNIDSKNEKIYFASCVDDVAHGNVCAKRC